MATHLIYGKATNRIRGASEIHTYCGEVIAEDHPDFAALRDYEPDHTATFFATIFNDIPDLCEACHQKVLSPRIYHIDSDNGLTYCGLDAAEVWTGGPFISPLCQPCRNGLISEHPLFGAAN